MEKLKHKHEQLMKAIATLGKALDTFTLLMQEGKSYNPHIDYDEEYRTHRDSVIQRFEYSIDLFWKYLKKYIEKLHITTGVKIPSEVIREVCSLNIINEDESEQILDMIKSRNMSSHIYVEEIAEQLAGKIPVYYAVLNDISQRLTP